MKKLLTGGILLFWIVNLAAQAPDTLWAQTYGGDNSDIGYSVQQTKDGGYIIVGSTYSFGAGDWDIYLIKTDANGDTLWTKTYGDSMGDGARSTQQTFDGGYIIAGDNNSNDCWLIKTDSLGNIIWDNTFSIIYASRTEFVQQTFDAGYMIVGWFWRYISSNKIKYITYLIKTDSLGNEEWYREFSSSDRFSQPEVYGATGFSGQQTIDGGYIIVGTSSRYSSGHWDVWLQKTDTLGNPLWSKTIGGYSNDLGYSVQQTADGGYIIAGWTNSYGAGDWDVYLIKTDSVVSEFWFKTFGGVEADCAYSVQQTDDGGYIITGSTASYGAGNGDVWLIKTDYRGNKIWDKTIGGAGEDGSYSVQQTGDGGYIVAGFTQSFGAGSDDVYLIKIAPEAGISMESSEGVEGLRIPGLVYGNLLRFSGINNYMKVKIFDILGREILSQDVSPQRSYIRLNNLTSGVYFLSLKEEKPELHKFVLIR